MAMSLVVQTPERVSPADVAKKIAAALGSDSKALDVQGFDPSAPGGGLVASGFYLSSGRQIVIAVREVGTVGVVRISDGGCLWSDLVFADFDSPRPSQANTERLKRIADAHRLCWDGHNLCFYRLAAPHEVVDAARDIIAVGHGLDAWRWLEPKPKRTERPERLIARAVGQIAKERGWAISEEPVRGHLHTWPVTATVLLPGKGSLLAHHHRAAIKTMVNESEDAILERVIGFYVDTHHPLVVATGKNKAARLAQADMFKGVEACGFVTMSDVAAGNQAPLANAIERVSQQAA